MTTRVTGMYSGLDTESIISELVEARSTKVTTLKNSKTKDEWKQDIWKELNTQVKSLQSTITGMQFSTDYLKKTTSVSNSSAVSVITGDGAMNAVQSLQIKKLAKSGYLTGAKLSTTSGDAITTSTKLSDLGVNAAGSFSVTTGGKTTSISVDGDTTVESLVSQLKSAGVNANFDTTNSRLFIGATKSGSENDFALTADNSAGLDIMNALGINAALTKDEDDVSYAKYKTYADQLTALQGTTAEEIASDSGSDLYKLMKAEGVDMTDPDAVEKGYQNLLAKAQMASSVINGETDSTSGAIRLEGSNSKIILNGATFESSSNNIEVNGLTFTLNATTADNEEITVTTQDDTDGIYDMIKNYIKQYNEVINKIDKLYNADSTEYEPLSDDEKEALSETEVEKWETTIKDSLLRKDTTLGTLFDNLKETMAAGYKVNGTTMYLTNFGIETLSYFEAEDNEKSAYHIDGDPDDSNTSGNTDKLKTMIATDPSTVVSFFTQLSNAMNKTMTALSKSSDYTSYGSFYEDKKLKSDIEDWDDKIDDAEEDLNDYEDKWYSKFSTMETALSKMNSNSSYLSNLFS